jgi:hypothetical protein
LLLSSRAYDEDRGLNTYSSPLSIFSFSFLTHSTLHTTAQLINAIPEPQRTPSTLGPSSVAVTLLVFSLKTLTSVMLSAEGQDAIYKQVFWVIAIAFRVAMRYIPRLIAITVISVIHVMAEEMLNAGILHSCGTIVGHSFASHFTSCNFCELDFSVSHSHLNT